MNININSSMLVSASNSVINESNNIETNIKNILSELDKLNLVWVGEDASSYILSMNEQIITALNNLQKTVADYANIVAGIGEAYDALDEAFLNKSIEV